MPTHPKTKLQALPDQRVRAPRDDGEYAGHLYGEYRDRLFGYCLYRLGDREEAEDAVQTAFLQAFRALRQGVVPHSEAAWLYKIAENVCLGRLRSTVRRRRVEQPRDLETLQDVVPAATNGDAHDQLIGLGEALGEMPESQRRAILLREWRGLSYKEIGERLGLTQAAVETLLFRARRSLARNLGDDWQEKRRRLRKAFDVGSLVTALKSALAGGSAVKLASAVAVVGVATAVAGGSAPVREGLRDQAAATRPTTTLPADAAAAALAADERASRGTASLRASRAVDRDRKGARAEAQVSARGQSRGQTDGDGRGSPSTADSPSQTAGSNSSSGSSGAGTGGIVGGAADTANDAVGGAVGGVNDALPPGAPKLDTPELPQAPSAPVQPPSLPVQPPAQTPKLPVQPPSLPVQPPSLPVQPPSLPVQPPTLPSLP